jgi:hypothetical protein
MLPDIADRGIDRVAAEAFRVVVDMLNELRP